MSDVGCDSPALQLGNHANAVAMALLRMAVGLFFIIFGQYKVFGSGFVHSGFRDYVEGFIHNGAYPFMIPVLHWILTHAATAMAIAVGYGEFLIGISLLIGLLSRVASIFGMYWGASLNWSAFAICFAVLAAGRPEETASLHRLISAGTRSSAPSGVTSIN
jgi:uncharacterized membrane protein YphA (DoxX/SURF4 family)